MDSGSTHNFIDTAATRRIGLKTQPTNPIKVEVGDGYMLNSNAKCTNFCWEVQGHKFETEVRLLNLGTCDAVLRAQWMKAFGKVTLDFDNLNVSFVKNG